jgi:hypothetical protein
MKHPGHMYGGFVPSISERGMTSYNAPNQKGQALGPCFKCGMSGHLPRQCPNKLATLGVGNQSRPQGQLNCTYGKVNHVTTKEAQQAQDVVLGMFFASSHPATTLFDSGASHSFISSTFIAKHHLRMSIMKHTMLVNSPGGEMRTKHICPAVSITIRGVEFLASLIILDFKGIDIILGMDWLRKYDRVIMCAKSNKVNYGKWHYCGILCSYGYRPSQIAQSSAWEFIG